MGGMDDGVGFRNDTWRSTDGGATWTGQTDAAGWTARDVHTSVAMPDGSIVLMGGYSNWIPLNDVWRSTDGGATWTNITPQDPGDLWTARYYHTSVALPDGSIIITGGNDGTDNLNDTWQLQPAGSSAQNPTHIYTAPGTYSVTLQAYNGDGHNSMQRIGYITVTTPVAPEAYFTGSPLSGTAPLTVSFTDASTGGPTGWAWFFGDETYGEAWANQTATPGAGAGWSDRYCHTSVALPDGSIVVMGGEDDNWNLLSDTWRSTDGGATWTNQTATSGADAGWSARALHSSVVLPDGSIVIMGGRDDDSFTNDTWRSTDGGATWTNQTATSGADAGWSARTLHSSVALPDGSIVLMGGQIFGDGPRNDVWRSTDGGATWTQLPDAGWTARVGHTSVALPDGSIVLMGGMDDGVGFRNDTWRSTDGGAHWTNITQQGPGDLWSARDQHTSFAMPDGSIVLMGGLDDNWNLLNDMWRSTDGGTTWTRVTGAAGWTERVGHTSVALPDGSIVIMGGNCGTTRLNDTWQLQPTGSSEQNPTHEYDTPGTYSVTLQAYNDDGYDSMRRIDYIAVSAAPVAPTADFSSTPLSGTAPLTVSFTDTSTGGPTGWAWFFGDETYGGAWTNQTDAAEWPARLYHASVAMPGGSIVLMGGLDDNLNLLNDTWRSTDGGTTWTEVNNSSGWTERYGHTAVALPDGSIVLMGGMDDTAALSIRNDVWRSTDGGATWTNITPQDPGDLWTARWGHTSVALPDGSIVIMGGNDDNGDPLNDTWRSTDGGATWTQLPDAGWSARALHSSVALPDGSIVLMGGEDDYSGPLNDTWLSTDGGTTWTLQTEHAGWPVKLGQSCVAMPDGSIVLMGGEDESGLLNDTWRSTDGGATWTNITPQDPGDLWTARWGHSSVALPDGSIIITGGIDDASTMLNDTWQLQPAGSSAQNPVHTYETPGIYSVTLLASNAAGYDTAEATGYITVTAPTPTPTSRPVYSGGGGGGSTGGPNGYNVGGDSAVSMVNVTGTGLEMLIVTGWRQSSPGAGIPPAPGNAYQYIDLAPARFTEITGANITFTVPVAWLEEHGFTPEEIVLYHYNGTAWEALPTWVVDAAGTTVTFRAATPGFSLFAISGIRDESAVTTPTAAQTTVQAAAEPTATQTTAAPAGGAAPDLPLGTIAIVAGAALVLIGAGFLVRRWWIRRQNPALFRDYD
jgi:PKD repeat protein